MQKLYNIVNFERYVHEMSTEKYSKALQSVYLKSKSSYQFTWAIPWLRYIFEVFWGPLLMPWIPH